MAEAAGARRAVGSRAVTGTTYAAGLDEDTFAVVDRALVRMRVLAAVVLLVQSLLNRAPQGVRPAPFLRELLATAAVLALLNGLSAYVGRRRGTRSGPRLAAALHAADVLVAVAVVATSRHHDVAWVLLVVPVLAGALRYRLRGALLTWAIVAVLHLAHGVGGAGADDADLAHVGQDLTRLAVVLLVALPAGYLGEHLLIEVRGLARVFTAAEHRSGLLEVVAESSQRVNDLDSQVFEAALDAACALGFAAADLWERDEDGWHRLEVRPAYAALPDLAVHVGNADCSTGPLVVEPETAEPHELAALQADGLAAVAMTPVAGRSHPTVLRAVLRRGAPLNPSQVECLELLGRQAGVALRNGELIADLHQAREELEHQAFHDHLTGIANRALFTRRLEQATADAARTGDTVALLFCDLDRFKAVNDGLGHDVGNDLLVAVVGRLRSCLRGDALLARMGGDEFTLLQPVVGDRRDIEHLAERVCKVLTQPFSLGGHEVIIGTSVGVTYGDATCLSPVELLRRADVAMYRSKARGRGCWTVWGPELEEATLTRLQLERDLRAAVDADELEVVYQPVVRADGTVAGAEALARWWHPQQGAVSPAQFIAIAEDSDLIVDLGWCVVRRAVAVAGQWLADAEPECFVAVNVSPRQLVSPGFADELDALLAEVSLAPGRLLLEITERIVSSGQEAIDALHDLSARGYRLALDDFGQGQTSLQHLRHFPLTALKIDRVFVSDADADPRVRVILAAIIDLGRALQLDVIAEGVETERQAEPLLTLGCTYLQGYALGRPVEAERLPAPAAPRPLAPADGPVVPWQRGAQRLPQQNGMPAQHSGTATQPSGTAAQHSGTAAQPSGTAAQPSGTAAQPSGTAGKG